MKPSLFVASSVDGLPIAYAVQQNLERDAEVTVWSQGIFEPTATALTSLLRSLPAFSFGTFVFHPDDVVRLRSVEALAVRDNVLFELGLFIGAHGPERCFIVAPRDMADFHWPTDLLGHRPLEYDSSRHDGNHRAALGPACQEIREVIQRLGSAPVDAAPPSGSPLEEGDQKVVLAAWLGDAHLDKLIIYADLDRELRLNPGTTKRYIKELAGTRRYAAKHEGPNTILFEYVPEPPRRSPYGSF